MTCWGNKATGGNGPKMGPDVAVVDSYVFGSNDRFKTLMEIISVKKCVLINKAVQNKSI